MFRTRKSKYNAVRVEVNGQKFPSKKEGNRYQYHLMRLRAGKIKMVLRQVPFHLPGGVKYIADFLIFNLDDSIEVEDVKGICTPLFIAKKKMVEALYPVKIEVV